MNYYKGYVRTKNKNCIDKFKDAPLRSFEEVKDLDEYAGILADGVILIDVDDAQQSEILMQIVEDRQIDCRVYQTTRGRHFLFKNLTQQVNKCGTHRRLACGLTADIKIGEHNSYEVIKTGGEERFIEWDCEEPQELPKFLLPIKTTTDFFEMQEGEGRNSALYSYILTLTREGFSKEESRDVLTLINHYVLKDSVSEDELDTIMRDDAFPKETFYNGKTFLHDNFARYLQASKNICRINGQLYIYEDGQFVSGHRYIESYMVKNIPSLKSAQRTEVLKYLDLIVPELQEADARYISFENGVYDITTGEIKPFSSDFVITNKIPVVYDPTAYDALCDRTLNKIACNDPSIRALLEEAIGYSFYRRNELSKAFFLTGEGSNGKSTFLDLIKSLLGKDNISELGMEELNERFSVAMMAGKLANIGDDISDEFLQGKAISSFKKIVSGNSIKGEFKGQDPFFFEPYTKLYFSANELPRTKSKGFKAVLRRMVIIPFNAHFSKSDPDFDPYIKWKLLSESSMKYLARLGIEGLKRVLENRGFTDSQKVNDELQTYELENNPIMLWIQDLDIENDIIHEPTAKVHRMYRAFCIENGFTEMSQISFSRELCKRLNLTTERQRWGDDKKMTSLFEHKED